LTVGRFGIDKQFMGDLDLMMLRREVNAMYTRVATSPDGEFHIHRGPDYSARVLGYDAQELAWLPVDNLSIDIVISNGVLNLARFDCFAGTTKERTARGMV
jgi:hypothetical protein